MSSNVDPKSSNVVKVWLKIIKFHQILIKNHHKILFWGAGAPPDPPDVPRLPQQCFYYLYKYHKMFRKLGFGLICNLFKIWYFVADRARKMSMKSQEVKLIHETNVSFSKKTWPWIRVLPKSYIDRPPPEGLVSYAKNSWLFAYLRPSFLICIFLITGGGGVRIL